MPGKEVLARLEEIEPPLEDVPKRGLGQLLEECLAYLAQEDRNLVFVSLLLKAGIIEKKHLGSPCKSRQVATKIARLLPHPFRLDLVPLSNLGHAHSST